VPGADFMRLLDRFMVQADGLYFFANLFRRGHIQNFSKYQQENSNGSLYDENRHDNGTGMVEKLPGRH
jgi:hypothetical protein